MNARHPLATLPALDFENHFARLPAAFYTRLRPAGLPAPRTVAVSDEMVTLLGLPDHAADAPWFADVFAGNTLLPGSAPLAAVYSGHQFGVWAGQLGDGRAHLLGGLRCRDGQVREIQLKGAGATPYSRGADGRAVLRSSIREFLASEAMAALGIPTTRALCLVSSPLPVWRQSAETAAVVTRIAPSFVRFGSFEHWAAHGDNAALRRLADHVIEHHRPACREAAFPYEALLADAAARTGTLVADWMTVGFMHGVMNTDNFSILGLTLDYGPFGFMERFDAGHICNHSDHHGQYAFRRQPAVAQWNLYRLANALAPLVGDAATARGVVDDHFGPAFEQRFDAAMRAKLGLAGSLPDDADFLEATYAFLQAAQPDFTRFFRALGDVPAATAVNSKNMPENDAPVVDLCHDRHAAYAWLAAWRARQAQTPWPDEAARRCRMAEVNPGFVLRNWLAEAAIRAAQAGDPQVLRHLLARLRRPYDDIPADASLPAEPPAWAANLQVSCSS